MAAKIRISSNGVSPFYGKGAVVAWIHKIKIVAKLQGIDDVTGLIVLYLEGSMLVLCLEMDEEDQLRIAKIKQCLRKAYTEGMYTVFAKLRTVRWTREQVDT